MQYQEAEVSDVFVVLKADCAERLPATVDALKTMGMEIDNTDADNGVIEGTLPADKLPHVKKWECVDYVRVDFTYIAEHPKPASAAGDAADTGEEDSED